MTAHTPGPYRLVIKRENKDGTPFEVEIVSDAVSQNYAAWLQETGKKEPEHAEGRSGWGQVSMGRFHGMYNGSGEDHGPKRMLSDEEAMANARFVLQALNGYPHLVEALEKIAMDGRSEYYALARAALADAGAS